MSLGSSPVLTRKTWERAMEPVNKIGYMDGASDGQSTVYQQSFDVGYEQGISFGLHLGFLAASMRINGKENSLNNMLLDPRRINCQICLNKPEDLGNIINLCDTQNEKILTMIKS